MFNGEEFCRRLKFARQEAGYTLAKAAEKVYLSREAVGYYEAGKRVPPIDRVCMLANLYGVNVDWLCGMGEIE